MEVGGPDFARLPEDIRVILLARAMMNLIVLSVALSMAGPGTAGTLYATHGYVRLGADGGIQVWSLP
jgi:hypothetical protein